MRFQLSCGRVFQNVSEKSDFLFEGKFIPQLVKGLWCIIYDLLVYRFVTQQSRHMLNLWLVVEHTSVLALGRNEMKPELKSNTRFATDFECWGGCKVSVSLWLKYWSIMAMNFISCSPPHLPVVPILPAPTPYYTSIPLLLTNVYSLAIHPECTIQKYHTNIMGCIYNKPISRRHTSYLKQRIMGMVPQTSTVHHFVPFTSCTNLLMIT